MQGRGQTEEWKGAGEGVNRGVEGCRGGGKHTPPPWEVEFCETHP